MNSYQFIKLHEEHKIPNFAFYSQLDKYNIDISLSERLYYQSQEILNSIKNRNNEIELNNKLQETIERVVINEITKKLLP